MSGVRGPLIAAGLLLALTIGAFVFWGRAITPRSERMTVVASFYPLYDWCTEVSGADAEVVLLTGSGDPHSYSPSIDEVTQLAHARALVTVGLGLEPWSRRAIESAGSPTELLEVGTWVERRPMAEHGHAKEEGEEHHHAGGEDPHVWLDPGRAAQIVRKLGDEFARLDPPHADGYRARAEAYAKRLDVLLIETKEARATLEGKRVIVYHDAFGYLFERLGLEKLASVRSGAGIEPDAHDLAEVSKLLREAGQRALFSEPGHERAAKALADSLNVGVAVLDPLELNLTTYGKDYVERMRHNIRTLVEVLK